MKETRTRGYRVTFSPTPEKRFGLSPEAASVLRGLFWMALYMAAVLAPLAVLAVGQLPPGRSFWTELSVAAGFVGLSVLCMQFAITSRFRSVASPYGIDMILQFHRQISFTALGLLLAHPLILIASDHWATLRLLNVFTAPWGARLGMLALGSLAVLIALSVWRRRIKLSYEAWKLSHGLLAVLVVGAGLGHVLLVGHYLDLPWKRALWDGYAIGLIGLLLYTRLARPFQLWRRPYVVEEVLPERGRCTTLRLRPVGHRGMRFKPGQFAWVRLGVSPFSLHEYPFSFSSSAEATGEIDVTVKALGDFTSQVATLPPGTRAYVDGPYGAFQIDRQRDATGYVLVAGGIGITPMMSILRTMADRGDRRPVILLYANKAWDAVTFREALADLEGRLDLTLVHVLEQPPEGWEGERGFVSAELLERHLPPDAGDYAYFLCGPPPMMAAVEHALRDAGVSRTRIVWERFNLV